MAQDWAEDVKRHVPDADDGVIAGIVRYCGIALQNKDSSLVSFGDPVETGRVRDNFLRKKLALTESDDVLDSAIASVGERMKGVSFKNRVTVYYLLAQHFGKLDVFGGIAGKAMGVTGAGAGIAGAAVAGAAALGAGAVAAVTPTAEPVVASVAAAAPVTVKATPAPAPVYDAPAASGGGFKWLAWLLLLAGIAAAIFALSKCSRDQAVVTPAVDPVANEVAAPAETAAPADTVTPAATAAAPVAAAIPGGDRVTSEMRDGKPALRVYFETARTAVPGALAASATALSAYLTANPTAKVAVSGFNDPRGNVAQNAALSRGRAENVRDTLVAAGVPADKIELVPPAAATDTSVSLDEARRVEVVVR